MDGWNLPQLLSLAMLPGDAVSGKVGPNTGGIETLSINRAFKLIDEKDHEGAPVVLTVNIVVKRTAMDASEQARVEKAVTEQDKRSNLSKIRRQEERDTFALALSDKVREGIGIGANMAKAENGPNKLAETAETIKGALALANVIQSLTPAANREIKQALLNSAE